MKKLFTRQFISINRLRFCQYYEKQRVFVKKHNHTLFLISIFIIALMALLPIGALSAQEGQDHSEGAREATQKQAESMKYVCPMHADVKSDKPGECPKCGMTLKRVKAESDEAHSHADPESEHHHDE